jgi:histidyl-tRNA synthetase
VELFGSEEPSADAEVISIAMSAFEQLGITGLTLKINSIGHPECRMDYNVKLKEFLTPHYEDLCPVCQERFHKNPMRILDCKERSCQLIVRNAPLILDHICEDCNAHFTNLKKYLEAMEIPYEVDKGIVRGLDYYSKTVFEIVNKDITVCGGGRYDYLIEEIGGPKMPAVGFGLGLERLLMTMADEGVEIPEPVRFDVFIASMGEEAALKAASVAHKLRRMGLKVDIDHMGKKLKAQMKYANKVGSRFTMILGEDELARSTASLKNMGSGEQVEVRLSAEEIMQMVQRGE